MKIKLVCLALALAGLARATDAHHCDIAIATSGTVCAGEIFTITTTAASGDCINVTLASFDPGPTVLVSGLSIPLGQPWIWLFNSSTGPTHSLLIPEGISLLGDTLYIAALARSFHSASAWEVAGIAVPICP